MNNTFKNIFLSKINKKSNGCWEWCSSIFNNGYGQTVKYKGTTRAHRVSWLLFKGKIHKNKCVLHKCDNKRCVNPSHLFFGSQKYNIQDMIKKGRDNFYPLIENGYDWIGEKNPHAKLTKKDVKFIRKKGVKNEIDAKYFAEKYKITLKSIYRVIKHDTWKNV